MKKQRITHYLLTVAYPLLTLGAAVFLWWAFSRAAGSSLILPSPAQTLSRAWLLLSEAAFWRAYAKTVLRSVLSFLAAVVAGGGAALLSRAFKGFRRTFGLIVSCLRAVPTAAVILLLVIWLKPALAASVVSLLVVMPTLYVAFLSAYDNIDAQLLDIYRLYSGQRRMYLTVFFPMLLPEFAAAIASGLSLTLKLMVAAEVLSNTAQSLGGMMNAAQIYLAIDKLLALTSVAVLTALVLEGGITAALKPLCRFKE